MPEIEERNKALIARFGEAQSTGRMDLLDELVADDFVRHCQATPWAVVRSRDDFKRFLAEDRAAVPDGRVMPRFLIAEGDCVAVWANYTGTHTGAWGPFPPTNQPIDLEISMVFRVAAGKIAELWVTWDNLAMQRQSCT